MRPFRRPSLRSQLNQIRLWVRQGRTDAWIAHKLDISVEQLEQFKRNHQLSGEASPAEPAPESIAGPLSAGDLAGEEEGPEPELEIAGAEASASGAAASGAREQEAIGVELEEPAAPEGPEPPVSDVEPLAEEPEVDRQPQERGERPRRRRRGRRAGRGRGRSSQYEGTFDHGDEGYGLWLDPAIADDPIYAEHWAGQRAVSVTLEPESITIRLQEAEDRED